MEGHVCPRMAAKLHSSLVEFPRLHGCRARFPTNVVSKYQETDVASRYCRSCLRSWVPVPMRGRTRQTGQARPGKSEVRRPTQQKNYLQQTFLIK